MTVEDRVRSLRAPGEDDAQRRAWEVAAAAHAARPAPRAPSRRPLALALAATAALLLAAVTPPGSAVADWVGDTVKAFVGEDGPPKPAKGLERLPGGGRVLVVTDVAEAWIAGEGAHRRLGRSVTDAAWSPGGRFVALGRRSELVAVDREGRRRWTVPTAAEVWGPVWSPDGFRVAYLTGGEVRLVAGDGTGDRRVAVREPTKHGLPFVGLAWRPGPRHVLAFSDRRTVFVADTDQRRVLWRAPVRGGAALAFSPDGRRLLVVGRNAIRVLDAEDGETLQRRRTGGSARLAEPVWDRSGGSFALVRRGRDTSEILVGRPAGRAIRLRRLFVGGDLELGGYSPDNRWLLVHWLENDSWLFLPLTGGRPRQVAGVQRRFRGFEPSVREWCCGP